MATQKTNTELDYTHTIYSGSYVDSITREIEEEAKYNLHNDGLILL